MVCPSRVGPTERNNLLLGSKTQTAKRRSWMCPGPSCPPQSKEVVRANVTKLYFLHGNCWITQSLRWPPDNPCTASVFFLLQMAWEWPHTNSTSPLQTSPRTILSHELTHYRQDFIHVKEFVGTYTAVTWRCQDFRRNTGNTSMCRKSTRAKRNLTQPVCFVCCMKGEIIALRRKGTWVSEMTLAAKPDPWCRS